MSLEVDSSSCDVDDEKEVTNGVVISIDDDSLTHLIFSISPSIDSEIYVPDSSHLFLTSLIDGAQPSDFQDVCFATSSLICVIPLTLIDLMCFSISFFVLGINTQSLLEDCEHLIMPIHHSYFYTYQFFPVAHNFPSLALYPHGTIEDFVLAVPYVNVSDISMFYQPHIRSIQVLQQIGRFTCDSHHNFAAIQGIGCEKNCLIFCTFGKEYAQISFPF